MSAIDGDRVREALRRRRRVILLLTFISIFAVLIFLFRAILTPFLVAVFVAYLIDPVVERMAPWRIARRVQLGRSGAIVIIYVILLSGLYVTGRLAIPALIRQMNEVRGDLPALGAWVEEKGQWVEQRLREWQQQEARAEPPGHDSPEEGSGDAVESGGGEPDVDEAGEPPGPVDGVPPGVDEPEAPGGEQGEGDEAGEDGAPRGGGGVPHVVPPFGTGRTRLTFRGGSVIEADVVSRTEEEVTVRLGQRHFVIPLGTIEKEELLESRGGFFEIKKLVQRGIQQATNNIDSVLGFAFRFAKSLVMGLYMFVLILMITAFLVIDRPGIVRFMHSLPPPHKREEFDRLRYYLDRGLAGVIRGQLAIMAVNGVLTWIGLQLLGVRYSLLLGFVAGLFSLIPIFGTILSTIPIVLISWGAGSVQQALLAFGWILLIHFLEANFLNPKIMGTASKIHPVVVVFALIAGEHAYGLAGALLAVPTASLLQSWFRFYVLDKVPEQLTEDEAVGETA